MDLALNNLQTLICHKTQPTIKPDKIINSIKLEVKVIHIFSKSIRPKENAIARLEIELPDHNSAVHRFNHYTTMTLHRFPRK